MAFLPPRENRANAVTCKPIMNEDQIALFYKAKAKAEQAAALKLLEKAAQKVLGKQDADKKTTGKAGTSTEQKLSEDPGLEDIRLHFQEL